MKAHQLIPYSNYYYVHLYKLHVKGIFIVELSCCEILEKKKTCPIEDIVAFTKELHRYLLASKHDQN